MTSVFLPGSILQYSDTPQDPGALLYVQLMFNGDNRWHVKTLDLCCSYAHTDDLRLEELRTNYSPCSMTTQRFDLLYETVRNLNNSKD